MTFFRDFDPGHNWDLMKLIFGREFVCSRGNMSLDFHKTNF